jgi:hypothetical protein
MRRFLPMLAILAFVIFAVPAAASPVVRLKTFGTGIATITSPDSATLVNDADEYSGVYLRSKSQSAKPIGAVRLSFDHSGSVAGGAPRFSIPIDTEHNGTIDGYAFVDAINCGNTGTVSTESPNCMVFFGDEAFANWDAFAAAHPRYRIAPGSIPFIIADQPGSYTITDIELR